MLMTAAKRLAAFLLAVPILLALSQPAHAKSIKVGNGTAASWTESALRSALTFAQGQKNSVILFNCGAGAVTITVTAGLTVPDSTTIDGAGLITLDGQSAFGLTILRIERGSAVVLRNLNISRGNGNAPNGGGISNEGTLT